MTSAFERFGINSLSPSALNSFRHNPAHWAVQSLMKVPFEETPALFRGNAVKWGLRTFKHVECSEGAANIAYDEAFRSFDVSCGGASLDLDAEDVKGERELIPGMLTQALTLYMGGPAPIAFRLRVEDWIDEIGMPVVAYLDFVFPETADTFKTTQRMPSAPSLPHLRQLALYLRARKERPRIAYVTPKKAQIFEPEPEQLHEAWEGMVRDAMAMQNMLAHAETPLDVVRMLPVDPTDYKWSAGQLQAALAAQTYIALPKPGGTNAALLAAE